MLSKQEKLILDLSLGDGHLGRTGYLEILHSEKQKEYLKYKSSLLRSSISYKNNNGYNAYVLRLSTNEVGRAIHKKLYGVMGHKFLSKEIVSQMDLYSFAILYCDDGSLCAKKRKGKIHAYDLTFSIYGKESECKYLINKLKSDWDLVFTLKRNKGAFSIRCGTREARKFLSLIRPLIPDFECFKDSKLKDISK